MPSIPALLNALLPTICIQAKLLRVCKLLPVGKLVAKTSKLASAGKWYVSEWGDGTKEPGGPVLLFVPGFVEASWLKTTFLGWCRGTLLDYLSASGSEEYP